MKKIVSLGLAVIMVFAMMTGFVACKNEKGNVLTMATNAEFPPYEYWEGDKIVGIDAEIAALIADELGMELRIESIEFGSIVAGVETGKFDFGMAGMTVTEDRLKSVNFSTTYATGIQVIIVKEGSEITSPDDMAAKADLKIGVQQDTTGDIFSTSDFERDADGNDNGKEVVFRYNKGADAVQALVTGKVDCVIIDNEPAKAFVAANEGLKILEAEYAVEDYAICVSKENEDLLNKINAAIDKFQKNGKIDEIINKYIGTN